MDAVEEIKQRLEIYDVVAQYVTLKKVGRNYKGLCPFHQEKTASFIVSPDKGMCYCFGCKQGGDIFEFIKLMERVDFKGAVELLADRVGITLSKSPQQAEQKVKKDLLRNVYRETSLYYSEQLKKNANMRDYLQKRGVSDQSIIDFEIGFAPDSYQSTYSFLLSKNYVRQEIIDAGIAIKKEIDNDGIYDRFRNRIIFPLHNTQGNIIGFTGRVVDKGEPKYLNSPESVLFKKGHFLYGLHLAKAAIGERDEAIIVEGNVDVVRSHQAGVRHVVASSGTALTRDQIKILKRYTNNVIFCLDMDKAGFEATQRAIMESMDMDIQLYLLPLPKDSKDPDEYIAKYGEESWRDYVNHKQYYLDYLCNLAFEKSDSRSFEGKKEICAFLFPYLAAVRSAVEREHFVKLCAQKMNIPSQDIISDLQRFRSKSKIQHKVEEKTEYLQHRYGWEEHLLGLILNYPENFEFVNELIDAEKYLDSQTERFYKHIQNVYNLGELPDSQRIIAIFEPSDQTYLAVLSLFIEETYPDMSKESIKKTMTDMSVNINNKNLRDHLRLFKNSADLRDKLTEASSVINRLNS